ncbi:hypothetical protein F4561_001460 [Lipingzhangella halophila]|uniref:Uncharacterized protein n=1 Tax=Lipingzhangella halophila TaxID=1783352 RepID=A0A7W7REU4_9ACTN|nr:hypothetical protein [Lipingzhangella halophila]MBB4930640.1 hypothetical protein [Lipingzhangella halophila]
MIRTVLAGIDTARLDEAVCAHLSNRRAQPLGPATPVGTSEREQRRPRTPAPELRHSAIAVDGKALRGSRRRHRTPTRLLQAVHHRDGASPSSRSPPRRARPPPSPRCWQPWTSPGP